MKKCIECEKGIEDKTAQDSYNKYGAVYCLQCQSKIENDEPIKTDEITVSAPSAPDEELAQINKCEANVSTMMPVPVNAVHAGAIKDLDIATIKKYINPKVTDQEAYMFLMLCKCRGLNPFTGEVHLIKYGPEAATTVVGKDAFTRRAEESGQLAGFEAGIIVVTKDDVIERRAGSCVFENETLVGGWAKVYRKDMPDHVFESEVSLSEYIGRKKDGTVNKMWTTKPATMIRKVPLVQVFREAFAASLGGMYDACEVGVDVEVGE